MFVELNHITNLIFATISLELLVCPATFAPGTLIIDDASGFSNFVLYAALFFDHSLDLAYMKEMAALEPGKQKQTKKFTEINPRLLLP